MELKPTVYLARALSVESKKVVVFKLSHRQRMLKFCGWKFHRDWIDMDYLCDRLGVEVRQLKIESFFYLATLVLIRKYIFKDLYEKPIYSDAGWDLGYFHSIGSTEVPAMERVASELKRFLKKQEAYDVTSYSLVHFRHGDMPSKYRITQKHIEDFLESTI